MDQISSSRNNAMTTIENPYFEVHIWRGSGSGRLDAPWAGTHLLAWQAV